MYKKILRYESLKYKDHYSSSLLDIIIYKIKIEIININVYTNVKLFNIYMNFIFECVWWIIYNHLNKKWIINNYTLVY